jgi:hypothetical protein
VRKKTPVNSIEIMFVQSKKAELIESIPRGLSASTVLVLGLNTE